MLSWEYRISELNTARREKNVVVDGKPEILLIYPGEKFVKPRLPLGLIVLATHCNAEGFSCRIIDERVEELTSEDILSPDLIGISTMSGEPLKSAINTARRIKETRPDVPLIWGGPHPSAYPVQTAESDLADFVVKAEGELPFVALCRRILEDENCDDLPAVAFRGKDGNIVNNPVSDSWIDMDNLRFPEYGLVEIKKYADHDDGFSYEASRGCPYKCTFCYVEFFHNRKWRGKSVDKIIEELKRVKQEIGVKKLYFSDDNFFGNKKRSLEICSRMIEEGLSFQWQATIKADVFARFTDDEAKLIKDSGCFLLAIGAESGSERILKEIKKGITPEQVKISVARCVEHEIMPQVSFVTGFPFEEDEDLEKTINLYNELMACGENVEINGLFIYLPYVGTPMFDTAVEYGYKPSSTLEGWVHFDYNSAHNNPWITQKKRKKLEAMSSIARFKYLYHRFELYSDEYRSQKLKSPFVKLGYHVFVKLFAKMADLRWKHMYFDYAIEWRLWRYLTFRIFKVG